MSTKLFRCEYNDVAEKSRELTEKFRPQFAFSLRWVKHCIAAEMPY